jgi:predicted transcriptional regulator
MLTKQAVLELIRKLLDDDTLSEIIDTLSVREKIEEGVRQLDAGQGIPHDEVMKRMAKWLV